MSSAARYAGWLLPALVALVYLPSLGFPFQFDDYQVIVDNPAVHSLAAWWHSMPGIRPLLKLSYALNWTLAPEAAAFRLINVALHAMNALLVWRILSELARRRSLPPAVALLAAALFALHPMQTEAVTYVCGRSVTLMAFFYLLSLLAWLHAARTGHAWLKLLSGLAFLCAFLSKETALILPATLWLLNRLAPQASARLSAPAALPASPLARVRAALASWRWPLAVAAAAIAFLLALPAYRDFLSVGLAQRSLPDNLALQVDAVFVLGRHLLQPALMNADPALPTTVHWNAALAAKTALLVLAIAMAALSMRRRSFAGFCVLWLFLHLAPTNSLIPRIDVVNDRQLYLGSIGAFTLFALLAWQAAYQMRAHLGRPRAVTRLAPMLLALALLAHAGWQTVGRNQVYRDEISFWQDVATKSPQNARAFNNLGYAYQLAGRHEQARAAYQRALALAPSLPQARWNLESLPPADATDSPSPGRPSSAR